MTNVTPPTTPAPSPGSRPSDFKSFKPTRPPEDLSRDPLLLLLPRDNDGRPMAGRIPILCRIGKGGMGAVYYAIHPRLNVEVAVKVLPPHLLDQDPKLADRFVTEARVAAALESDHVVRVLDVDREGTTFFLVMQYVEGESAGGALKRRMAEGAPALSESDALQIVTAAARGLAAAHARGIVHRDIKPDNILIPRGALSRAKLADLGLAKPEGGGGSLGTQSNIAMGTPGYMAPEQIEDARTAGPPADVFSMGATLYALLSGRAPFQGTSLAAVLRQTATQEPPPLPGTVSAAARAIVERCLSKDPARRFAHGGELLRALEEAQTSSGERTVIPEANRPALRRSPLPWLAAAAAFLVAGTAALLLFRGHTEPLPPPAPVTKKEPAPPVRESPPPAPPRAPEPDPSVEKKAAYRDYMRAADVARISQNWPGLAEAASKAEANALTPEETRAARDLAAQAAQQQEWAAAQQAEKDGRLDQAVSLAEKAAAVREAPAPLARYIADLKARKTAADERAARLKEFSQWTGQARGEKDPAAALALWKRAENFIDRDADRDEVRKKVEELSALLAGLEIEKRRAAALAEGEKLLGEGKLDPAEAKFSEAAKIKEDAAARSGLDRVREFRARKLYDAAMAEARDAEEKKETARAKAAYARALAARPGDDAAAEAMKALEARTLADRITIPLDRAGTVRMEFVRIKAGKFTMGNKAAPEGQEPREVTLTKDFWMQTTETTQAQWRTVMGTSPFNFSGNDLPAENVSWDRCMDFTKKLGEVAGADAGGRKFDLPTEAEWEYAARAGSTGQFCFNEGEGTLADYAWYGGTSGDRSHPVAKKKPNAWGLYDMHGNVWEWCRDWYGRHPVAGVDPTGPAAGMCRILRGFGWNQDLLVGYTPDRLWYFPTACYNYVGLRVVMR
jgi:serine/threonine protein kinase/formylglycine-generating enzyme required for sulfatase activity